MYFDCFSPTDLVVLGVWLFFHCALCSDKHYGCRWELQVRDSIFDLISDIWFACCGFWSCIGCFGSWEISRICIRFRLTSLPPSFVTTYDRGTPWIFSFISAGSHLCVAGSWMLIFWPEFNAGSGSVSVLICWTPLHLRCSLVFSLVDCLELVAKEEFSWRW